MTASISSTERSQRRRVDRPLRVRRARSTRPAPGCGSRRIRPRRSMETFSGAIWQSQRTSHRFTDNAT